MKNTQLKANKNEEFKKIERKSIYIHVRDFIPNMTFCSVKYLVNGK